MKYVIKFFEWIVGYKVINIKKYYDLVEDIKNEKVIVIDNNSPKEIYRKRVFIKNNANVISDFYFEHCKIELCNNTNLLIKDSHIVPKNSI